MSISMNVLTLLGAIVFRHMLLRQTCITMIEA